MEDLADDLRPLVETLIGPLELTSTEVARAAGIDLERARSLWRALGFPPVPDDARVFTRADADVLMVVRDLLALGRIDGPVLLQLTRVTGQALARIADAQATATGPWLEQGMAAAVAALPAFARDLERLLSYVWRRHLLAALLRRAATPSEVEGITAVGFADLVGFTVLSQALDPQELATMVDRFEAIAYEHIPERGGRVIKMIGDEVMFAVADAEAAAEIALGLAEAHSRRDDVPEVRVGLARGPTLAWEGDLYGPTVNLASRLVNVARPGTVLVSEALGDELKAVPAFALRHLRAVRLQGIGRVRSWVLRRAK